MGTKQTSGEPKKRMSTATFVGGTIITCIVVVGGAILIGKSDSGEINVSDAIQSSNQANMNAEGDPNNNIGTVPETFKNMPNGGLVPAENQNTPTEVPATPVSEETATTTPENASDVSSPEGTPTS